MNAVLFNEPLDLLLYKETGMILFYLIPCLIFFIVARKKARNLFIFGMISSTMLFLYLFYPNLYNPITQINSVTVKNNFLTAKNSLDDVIISSSIEKVRFYCIYTISSRGNKFYNKGGIEINNRIYHFSLKRNCDEFYSRLRELKLAMNYAEKDSFPEIGNQETRSLTLQTITVVLGILIVLILNRKFPINGK